MGVVDKIESALHLGGHTGDQQHHHHDHKTEHHEKTTTSTTGPGGVTTDVSNTSKVTGTQGASTGAASGATSTTPAVTDSTTTHVSQPATSSAGQSSANAALASHPAPTTTASSATGTTSEVRKEEHSSTPAGTASTVVSKTTGPAIGGQHDGQGDHATSDVKHDTPVQRHDQLHESVDFKPNLENPSAIPSAGGKDIGAGVVDHNATGTIGKDIDTDRPTGLGTDHAHDKPLSGDKSTNEHAVQSDNKPVTDPSTSTGPGNTIHPASAGFTTTGLDHDNVPGHSRGH